MIRSPREIPERSPEEDDASEAQPGGDETGAASAEQSVRRRPSGPYPLSLSQERRWLLQQPDPAHPGGVTARIRLSGKLDRAALEASLSEVVRRHEALRTTFVIRDGTAMQAVSEELSVRLTFLELDHLSESEQEEAVEQITAGSRQRWLELAHGPPLQATLARRSGEDHLLLLALHPLAADRASVGVLLWELAALYGAFTQGQPSPLPHLTLQYGEFALWQREWLEGRDPAAMDASWKEQWRDRPALLAWPADRCARALAQRGSARQPLNFSRPFMEKLQTLRDQAGVPLSVILLAGWLALLARCCGQEEIGIGLLASGRSVEETEPLIGCFEHLLPLWVDLAGDPPFRELLGRARQAVLEARTQSEVPRQRLIEQWWAENGANGKPLVPVAFDFQESSLPDLEVSGLTIYPEVVHRQIPGVELGLSVWDSQEGLAGWIEYRTELWEAATVSRMAAHYRTLLEGAAAMPGRRLSELPLLTEPEQRELLAGWNDTQADYPRECCVHQLFEQQARRTPEAVALVFEGRPVSYADLNRRANQLAHALRRLGVGPEVLVGLCVERSIEMVVGLLGILKAGGAYLPLDPAYPEDRLTYMLEDAQALAVVTQQRFLDRLPATAARPVCLDREAQDGESTENPESGVGSENLAYVIYTSGSTGRPKGVMIPHRGVVNYVSWCIPAYAVAAGSGAPVHSPLGFDLTITGLLPPLLAGRTVTLVPEGPGIEALSSALRSGRDFSLVKITPAHLALLSEWLRPEEAAGLARALVIGGEALNWDCLGFWQQHAPDTRLINEYGPTETVVGCCVYEAPIGHGRSGPVPIGRPIANTQLYVLDRSLRPVPIGIAGELYIGGEGVGRGYLHRPGLTAARFIPDPFSQKPGARLYKTGDLARYLPEGHLEFLGRIDDQVKLRGFRVELGEIEATLEQHPHVREAAVMLRKEEPGDERLVAYVVPEQEAEPTAGEIRRFLRERLPEYMVPAALVLLDALPLTANGKVDRRALPAPGPERPDLERAFVAPRTALERRLAQIWEKALGIRPIGVTDNFFDMGGHSILAVRMAAQIGQALRQDLPLRILFQAPTVEQLAGLLGNQRGLANYSPLIAVQPGGSRPPFFCTSILSGGVNYYRHLARYLGPDQPVYALDPGFSPQPERRRGSLYSSETRFKDTAALYVREIRRVQPEGPYMVGGHSLGGIVALEVAQQLHALGQKVGLLALFEPFYPHWRIAHPYTRKSRYYLSQLLGSGLEGKLIHLGKLAASARERGPRILYRSLPAIGECLPGPLRNVWRMHVGEERDILGSEKYVMREYPGRVTLFWSTDRPLEWYREVFAQWERIAAGGVAIDEVPGDHMTMVGEPHIQVLAQRLKACLHQAQDPGP